MNLLLNKGNIDSIISLSSIPFSWNNKKTISSELELKSQYKQIFINTTQRPTFILDTIYIKTITTAPTDKAISAEIYCVEQILKYHGGEDNTERKLKALFLCSNDNTTKNHWVVGRVKTNAQHLKLIYHDKICSYKHHN